MDLQKNKLLEEIPPMGSQNGKGLEAIAFMKFFTPWSYWSWYPVEFDGYDTFYGFVDGIEKEFGYFLLSELKNLKGPFGLKVEVDEYFEPKQIKKIIKND